MSEHSTNTAATGRPTGAQAPAPPLRVLLAVALVSLAVSHSRAHADACARLLVTQNLSYMIISAALFALGLGGIWVVMRPGSIHSSRPSRLAFPVVIFALSTATLRPLFNLLPFDFGQLARHPAEQLLAFTAMYAALSLPFFCVGVFFASVFARWSPSASRIYFWDLGGAAFGSFLFLPFIPSIGPGGILLGVAATGLVAAACLAESRRAVAAMTALALGLVLAPAVKTPEYFEFLQHQVKLTHFAGGVRAAQEANAIELTRWDPVARIDVLDLGDRKEVAYDGGAQATTIFRFDGDLVGLRHDLGAHLQDQFWNRSVLASHYLKRDQDPTVLVIGAAAGQEVKAALMFGARRVDAVEMVRAVVELGTEDYAIYNGGILLDPRVEVAVAEGRSWLRSADRRYDVIQMYSNHTTSGAAAGSAALSVNYLQTVEAYLDYYRHLAADGVLQVNLPVYPRVVTTAAAAWRRLGRSDFRRHVLVVTRDPEQGGDLKDTVMVKMSPWTTSEVDEIASFFAAPAADDDRAYVIAESPLGTGSGTLDATLFSGAPPEEVTCTGSLPPGTPD